MAEPASNPDREVVRAFLIGGGRPQAIDSNPIALGLQATLTAANAQDGTVTIRFEAGAQHLQGAGQVHGGVVATMLDLATALSVLARLPADQNPATVSLNVSMLRPVAPGVVTATAQVDRAGRRIVHASARLADGAGALLASASAVFAIV